MKMPVIKNLAQSFTIEDLETAEERLPNGEELPFVVGGDDEGEQLTHILSAIAIKKEIQNGKEFNTAFREFAAKVRGLIQ